MWFISEPRSNSPPWDCQQCGHSEVISPTVAVGNAAPRPPLVSSLLVTVTDILGREGPLQSEGTLQATVPLWSRKQTGMTPGSAREQGRQAGRPLAGAGVRVRVGTRRAGGGRSRRGFPPKLTPGGSHPPHALCLAEGTPPVALQTQDGPAVSTAQRRRHPGARGHALGGATALGCCPGRHVDWTSNREYLSLLYVRESARDETLGTGLQM